MTSPIDKPGLSIIVATLDRCDYLRLCIDALVRQTARLESFEVIIVDNGSRDGTADLVGELAKQYHNVVYIREERRGLSAARNAGLRIAQSELVAFTDDDAIPETAWVEKISNRFATLDREVAVLGGEVRPIWEAPRPAWLTDKLLRPLSARLMWGPCPRVLNGAEWLMEVNIAYRKAELIAFGGFPEFLGRIGDSLLSCDGCVNLLLARAGYRFYYDPDIVVGHHIHAARLTPSWFRRRFFWQGVSMRRVHNYLEDMSKELNLASTDNSPVQDAEVILPASASAWAEMFSDEPVEAGLEHQFHLLEQLGYLLQSQSLIDGR